MTQTTTPHIAQVRQALLDTLGDLRNRHLDVLRTRELVDTAKVENEYLRLTGQDRSAFLEEPKPALALVAPTAHNPFPTSVVHRMEE